MLLRIRGGKTGDRYAPLSPTLLAALRMHYRAAKIDGEFLFPGRPKTKPVTRNACRHVLDRAARDAGISKRVSPCGATTFVMSIRADSVTGAESPASSCTRR